MDRRQLPIVAVLGTTQTLAWASSYYLPAILADRIARDLGVSGPQVFAAFSAALLLSAFVGPRVVRTIDAVGGREVLSASNMILAGGLVLLALAHGTWLLWAGWLVLGLGMGLGLYDAAFAALGRIYGAQARSAITGITLIAGFASTVGWPLTAWGASEIGWRNTCLAWAAANILIGLPLNRFLLPKPDDAPASASTDDAGRIVWDRSMLLLAFAFASAWMVTSAMATHLPRILQAAGASTVQAVTAGALIGPAQVAARVFEAGLLSRFHPLVSARLATITHPIGAAVLGLAGGGVASGAFAVLHGSGNGIVTIARGTVPLALFGPVAYGHRLGLIGAPARMAQAAAPLLFGVLIERYGSGALVASSVLSLMAFAALCLLRPTKPDAPAPG